MGAEAQDADAERVAAADAGAGEEDPPAGVDAAQELGGEALGFRFPGPQPEGHHRELRLVEHLEPGVVAQHLVRPPGEGQLLGELLAEGRDAVEDEGQPQPQSAEVAGELGREVGEAERALVGHILDVARRPSEGAGERRAVADEEGACAVGQEEALVRVERHRVALLDPPQEGRTFRGQPEEAAVGGVGVNPEAVPPGDGEGLGQGVDGAGVRRAHVDDDEEGPPAPRAILPDGRVERLGDEAETPVGRQRAQARAGEAGEARGLGDAVVRLVGEVDDAVLEGLVQTLLSRGDEGAEGREGAAGGEDAARSRGQAHERAQPGDRRLLDLGQGGRGAAHAHVAVRGRGDEVGEGRGVDAAPRDVGEVAGAGCVVALRDRGLEPAQDLVEGAAGLRNGLAERRAQELRAAEVVGGLGVEARDVVEDDAGYGAGHLVELLPVGLEGMWGHAGILSRGRRRYPSRAP